MRLTYTFSLNVCQEIIYYDVCTHGSARARETGSQRSRIAAENHLRTRPVSSHRAAPGPRDPSPTSSRPPSYQLRGSPLQRGRIFQESDPGRCPHDLASKSANNCYRLRQMLCGIPNDSGGSIPDLRDVASGAAKRQRCTSICTQSVQGGWLRARRGACPPRLSYPP